MEEGASPWTILWVLLVGYFMILVDSTIVSIAIPSIITDLHATVAGAAWVSSAYLLAYAVPILISARLGDRLGQRSMYIGGLLIFTGASLGCGLAGSLTGLVLARCVQGLGASAIMPQPLAVITRLIPADRRGPALACWSAVGGIAGMVGPQIGGLIVGALGWHWIFLINLPIGILGIYLAVKIIPSLPTTARQLDIVGVALSGVAFFLLVFGIQEGPQYRWSNVVGPFTVCHFIVAGVVLLMGFVGWQACCSAEPLVPLRLFGHRSFVMGCVSLASTSFAITSLMLLLMLDAQQGMGDSPTQAALLFLPITVVTGTVAQGVGRLSLKVDLRYLAGAGFVILITSLIFLGKVLSDSGPVWCVLVLLGGTGFGAAFISTPVSVGALRRLPLDLAGAGAGVFTASRLLAAVFGSACTAAIMESKLSGRTSGLAITGSPAERSARFAVAVGDAVYLPVLLLIAGFLASVCLGGSVVHSAESRLVARRTRTPVPTVNDVDS
ncbi:MAG: DHA2 family efflux MFS transporter permease subunit [Pseudonocardiaceae bacterium]